MHLAKKIILTLGFFWVIGDAIAQQDVQKIEVLSPTGVLISKTIDDSTRLLIMSKNVTLRHNGSYFYCDSCVLNNRTNIFEAWGNVHINQGDTTHIYAGYLRYDGKTKMANLKDNVKLTNSESTLTAPDLDYNMDTKIGIYKHGGKVVNKKSILTSTEGWYYADLKDIYFKDNVKFTDPAYNFETDSVLYNTETQKTRFIAQTTIKDSSGRIIKTTDGHYDQINKKAEFNQRSEIVDKETKITANRISFNDSIYQAEGNAIIVDTKNKYTMIAGLIFRNKSSEAILATNKPLLLIEQTKDSVQGGTKDTILIKADTLFSARLTDKFWIEKKEAPDTITAKNDSSTTNDSTIIETKTDSTIAIEKTDLPTTDTIAKALQPNDSMVINKIKSKRNIADSTTIESTQTTFESTDLLLTGSPKFVPVNLNKDDSTNRYFEAYSNVKIFHDSVQCMCDSLFYSFHDSVFRLFKKPVVWAEKSQVTGDTILLFTKNKKADKVEAYFNSLIINHIEQDAFNQVKSKRLDAWFKAGEIDSVRAYSEAKSIYYLQDEDSAYSGITECTSNTIAFYFQNKELYKVALRQSVDGTIWPFSKKTPAEMQLPGFIWLEDKRPKSKIEMYE